MQARKILSMILALALLISVIAPCRSLVHAAEETLYGENLEQVTAPVVGEEYYLGADVAGTMYYFSHSTLENTVPYSLPTRTNFTHNWTVPVTLESPTVLDENVKNPGSHTTGFQMVYTYVKSDGTAVTSRIYCIDKLKDETVAGQTGVMDTGATASSNTAYKNRHNFFVDNEDHWIRSTYKNDHVLVAKKLLNGSKEEWRMLFVPETDLANDGVYPVMLLKEHKHTFGAATTSGDVTTRSCTACGYTETAYAQLEAVTEPTIGNSYNLAANVDGQMLTFTTGGVGETDPYSLRTAALSNSSIQVALEAAVEEGKGEFQMTFPGTDSSGNPITVRIYCYDDGTDGDFDTGTNSKNGANFHTFFMDEVDGVTVLRKYYNNRVLVVKYNETTATYRMLGVEDTEIGTDGVYPVMLLQEHTHVQGAQPDNITDDTHGYTCWCGGIAKTETHTYGKSVHDLKTKTTTRTCTVCGYVAAVHGHSQAQVKYPTIGETYYLSANVDGTMQYFHTDTKVTYTAPYSLGTTDDINHAKIQKVTLEDPSAVTGGTGVGFQMTYPNADGTKTVRVYCYNAATADPELDTGTASRTKAEEATFIKDQVVLNEGTENEITLDVLRKTVHEYVLVAKQLYNTNTKQTEWRMQCVPESDLTDATEVEYPVMLTTAHTEHTYDNTVDGWTFDEENNCQSRLCTVCGHAGETMYGTTEKVERVTEPTIGESYYLAANVGGTLQYFRVTPSGNKVTYTTPYSVCVTDDSAVAQKITLENAIDSTKGDFQLAYSTYVIYCENLATGDPAMDTGVTSKTGSHYTSEKTSFFVDQVNGVPVIRKYGNNNVLVVKTMTNTNTQSDELRLLGVEDTELGNEGVYPAMLVELHEHQFGEEAFGDSTGHYYLCDCQSKSAVVSHSFGEWTLDRVNQKQTATCEVCEHKTTVASPYFDTVDSLDELTNGLAKTVADEDAQYGYAVSGGKDYLLMTEIGDDMYYFRNVGKTAGGNTENTSSTAVAGETGHSLFTTNDPNHNSIIKTKVTPGNTENTYVIYAGKNIDRVVYINDESADGAIDTGLTAFRGVNNTTAYKNRSEFKWDEENNCLYQDEGGVKYVLVMKQMTASYNSGAETGTEWRIVGVPEAQATPEQGNYPVKLAQHVHNLSTSFENDGVSYYRDCGCGYKATVTPNFLLGEGIGVNFDVKLEKGETVTATVADEEAEVLLTEKSAGTYSAFVQVAAAQMTDEIKISVGGDALDVPFTVKAAAEAVLADSNYNQYAKDLANHMLAYGAAAQTYFGYNTDNLAGSEMAVTMPTETVGVEVHSDLEGVQYHGASVRHEGRTVVRFYFEAEAVDGLTFTADGNVYEPVSDDGMYYIEVSGINPQNLDKDMNVVVTKGEQNLAISYSPLTYITRTYNRADASDTLKALVTAMYGYHKAAKTYIANMYLGNGFTLKSQSVTSLYEGVDQYASTYVAQDVGEVKAYAIVIDADANVELKVSAGDWDENSTAENPGETKTVVKHFRDMKNAGNNVLAMINGGFFDLNSTKTMKPYGMQIVDGVVKQAPTAGGNYSDNWFGMTADGKYVISDAAGYESILEQGGSVQQGVGGGKLLIVEGVVQDIASSRDYRTAVGVNAAGDLVLVAVESATYSDVSQIFVDLGMDIVTVLNLDGGGSTAMYVPGAFYPKALILGDDGLLPREVADAVGIVVKK